MKWLLAPAPKKHTIQDQMMNLYTYLLKPSEFILAAYRMAVADEPTSIRKLVRRMTDPNAAAVDPTDEELKALTKWTNSDSELLSLFTVLESI